MQPVSSKPILYLILIFLGLTAVAINSAPAIQNIVEAEVFVPNIVEEKPVFLQQEPKITHISTPEPLYGMYMTSWVAGTPSIMNKVLDTALERKVNAIVFDIKDYTGKIAYPVKDLELAKENSSEKKIKNLEEFTRLLHSKNLYVIGRVAVFQDPHFVRKYPEFAVKTSTDTTKIWLDRKGISWLDAGEEKVWKYIVAIAKDAHAQGVDEIQFDYIRFPSDGNMKDIYYPVSNGISKSLVISKFFKYINTELFGTGIVTSADLFGMTTVVKEDMGIGQILEDALINFDYVSPMVYPSHFYTGWEGISDPQSEPYKVIKISMTRAGERADTLGIPRTKLRPWLQEFGLYGMKYGRAEILAQIQGTYDSGLTSWLLWDPSNRYASDLTESENSLTEIID
ncbi:MAG: hypothetical protein KBC17_00860 [Candidatus Pacebacteria bacterium]|nr:hypothetical protein [Candidatus Paceibacterota bacterium]